MTLVEHFARGLFPTLYNRTERFPGGESKDEVAVRAQRFLDEVLMPYVWQEDTGKANSSPIHVVVVSHGLFIPELILLMARKDEAHKAKNEAEIRSNVRGMRNTAWTRVEFGFQVRAS
jgi:broad specificity phosphatase PhoE